MKMRTKITGWLLAMLVVGAIIFIASGKAWIFPTSPPPEPEPYAMSLDDISTIRTEGMMPATRFNLLIDRLNKAGNGDFLVGGVYQYNSEFRFTLVQLTLRITFTLDSEFEEELKVAMTESVTEADDKKSSDIIGAVLIAAARNLDPTMLRINVIFNNRSAGITVAEFNKDGINALKDSSTKEWSKHPPFIKNGEIVTSP